MKWEPIETAPKDGTAVLALIEGSDIPQSVRYRNGGWKICWDDYRIAGIDGPTHWMPIPSADDLSALKEHDDALENCRLFAARNRNEEWAKTILRFCSEAGITGSPLRADAIEKGGE